ncbi:hypothetical protein TELCIR_20642, partial [Teladorsagia circumcincta]
GYTGAYQGQIDPFSDVNIKNAAAAGLGVEVVMIPQPTSASKTGAKQFDEMYEKLQEADITIRSIWVQDTKVTNTTEICFHHGSVCLKRYSALMALCGKRKSGRYWSARGTGAVNESPPNFDDFQPFASWTSPSVKQFAKFETVCGVIVN